MRKRVNGTLEGRRWNEETKDFKNGKFDENEVQKLMHSICAYVQEKNIGKKGLKKLLTENTKL